MSTIRAKVSARRFVDVPALQVLGQWALHGSLKPKTFEVSEHTLTVTHVPSGLALAYNMSRRDVAETLLAFAHQEAPPGVDPDGCAALLRAGRRATMGMLAATALESAP